MNIKVDFDNIVVKEDKNDFNVKVLMLKGEKGDQGDGEPNVIETVQVNGTTLPVTNKTVNVLVPTIDSAISSSSTNPVQNKVIKEALDEKVDTSTLDNYYQISEIDALFEQIRYFFNTVSEMKAYDLQEGDYVITKGYYSANDGGSAEYIIKSSSNGYYETLNNNLVAELIVRDKINVKQLGAYGDGEHDDITAIQNAIEYGYNKNLNIYLPNGIYKITDVLFLYENQRLYGENSSLTEIHKTTNTTTTINNTEYDAILLLRNHTTISDDANNIKIDNIRLRGNIAEYVSDKTVLQYAILGVYNTPKLQISNFLINNVDIGIQTPTMYTGWISKSTWLQGFYCGIKITQGFQYTNIEDINIGSAHDKGIYVSGGNASTISNICVEWNEGCTCYHFEFCSLRVINCGAELGTGFAKGIYAFHSNLDIAGCYFDGNRTDTEAMMIDVNYSVVDISDTTFGYEDGSSNYLGYFAYVRNNSQLILGHGIKATKPFEKGIKTNDSRNSLTIGGSTINLYGEIISIAGNGTYYDTEYTQSLGMNILSEDYQRNSIYTGFINNPMKTKNNSNIEWQPSFNKGDIGIFNNPNVTGKVMWYCNRSNSSNYEPQTVGTISNIATRQLTFTDLTLEDYATTGIRLYNNCTIEGVTSGATALVSWVDYVNKQLNFASDISGFVSGEKVKLKKTTYIRQGDYLYVPFIHSGPTVNRPTANLITGQMYFDITLGKPIWYRSGTGWVDATGTQV